MSSCFVLIIISDQTGQFSYRHPSGFASQKRKMDLSDDESSVESPPVDPLESFREKWQRELVISKQVADKNVTDNNENEANDKEVS